MKARLNVKAKLFVLCFAIENKKIYRKKDRPSIFIALRAIFDVEYHFRRKCFSRTAGPQISVQRCDREEADYKNCCAFSARSQ